MLLIKNWSTYQHYKDRRPPWIKLHRDVMNDMDFMALTMDQRGLLMSLWILAAEDNGQIPDDPKAIAWRMRVPVVDIEPLVRAGFILRVADASNTLADASAPQADASLETEGETEKRQRDNGSSISPPVQSEKAVDLGESLEGFGSETFEEYVREIMAEFCRVRGFELPVPSHRDFDVAASWHAAGIPLRIVLRGMADCLETMRKGKRKPADYPLAYYTAAVKEAAKMNARMLA